MNNTLKSVLAAAIIRLDKLPNPRLEAELLLAHSLQRPRSYLFAHAEQIVTPLVINAMIANSERRANGEPLAYIVGKKEFWSLELSVNSHTLIPRPETELLVEEVLKKLPAAAALVVADLGTGSGAIALAIAKERPHWQVIATDQFANTLAVAKKNADHLGLLNIAFYSGDWCRALPDQTYAAIISNPPYIAADDPYLVSGDLRFEPQHALVAADNGLAALTTIIHQSSHYLRPSGWLLLEHGYNQGADIRNLLFKAGYIDIHTLYDLAQHERITVGRKRDAENFHNT